MAKVEMSSEFKDEEEAEQDLTEEVVEAVNLEIEEAEFEDIYEPEEGMQVEDLDPTEEIWPGGPTAAHIVQWKQQYGDVFVSSFTPDVHVVWRTLNRFEYRNHMKRIEQMGRTGQMAESEAALINEEALCEVCVLYPKLNSENLMGEMAGLPSALAQDILEASGFVALEVRKL